MEETIDTIFLEGSIKKIGNDKKTEDSKLYFIYPSHYYELKRIIKEVREYFTLERKVA